MSEGGFHHRSAFSAAKKPFKGKSKGKLKNAAKGKIESRVAIKSATNTLGRRDRANQGKQRLTQKRADVLNAKRLGKAGNPPKIIAFVPLSPRVDLDAIISNLKGIATEASVPNSHPGTVCLSCEIDGKPQKLMFFKCPRDPLAIVDISLVADVVLPVITADEEGADLGVDAMGYHFTKLLKSQGFSSVIGLYQDMVSIKQKKQAEMKRLFTRYYHSVFEDEPKVLPIDTQEQAVQMLRWIANLKLREPVGRMNRNYSLIESLNFTANADDANKGTVEMAGFVRGKCFNVNRIIHITGFRDFQVEKIEELMDGRDIAKTKKKDKDEEMTSGAMGDWTRSVIANADAMERDNLQSLNELDTLNNEQSVITDEEIRQAELAAQSETKEMDDGVSDYQKVWNDIVSSEDDDDEEEAKGMADEDDDDGGDRLVSFKDPTPTASESGMRNVSHVEKQKLERDEITHPDEVDTPELGRASERFAKYRGLKSFRNSEWDRLESLPLEYGHLSEFEDFSITRSTIIQEFQATAEDPGGNRYVLHVKDVTLEEFQAMTASQRPLVVWGLYKFENKVSVLHFHVRRNPEYEGVVKGKEKMVFQVGFRRFCARPIYTSHVTKADKHMVERFFHQGRFSMASVYTHIQFPPGPVLMFLPRDAETPSPIPSVFQTDGGTLVATGTQHSVDPGRLLIKRVILTGTPVGINKRAAVIKRMFYNPEDIRYWKPVEIWTKTGLMGHIKEPRGTKGLMKCVFSSFIKSSDTVCMSLYKRQFPPFDRTLFE